jgi:hypothetical protein
MKITLAAATTSLIIGLPLAALANQPFAPVHRQIARCTADVPSLAHTDYQPDARRALPRTPACCAADSDCAALLSTETFDMPHTGTRT